MMSTGEASSALLDLQAGWTARYPVAWLLRYGVHEGGDGGRRRLFVVAFIANCNSPFILRLEV